MMKRKKVLITAGSTLTPIDQVRGITNIFAGRTGTAIARFFSKKSSKVTLITSSPYLLHPNNKSINVIKYKTFDDLLERMREEICSGEYDIVIHSAAVSDYRVSGVYYKDWNNNFIPLGGSGKVSSKFEHLHLKLSRTEKIVDLIRSPWGFKGALIKFKLEIGKTDKELIEIAKKSRAVSEADIIVANCLEWSRQYAYIIHGGGSVKKVARDNLPKELYEKIKKERGR